MKKILLSLTALTFCASVAFAQEVEVETQPSHEETQTQPGQEEAQTEDLQIERLSNTAETSGKRKIEMSELPAAVQEAFQNSEFKDWEISGVYEVKAEASEAEGMMEDATAEDAITTETEEATEEAATATETASQEASYEILLITKDMKDEIEDTQEIIQEEKEDAMEDGEEAAEIATEKVSVEIPGVVLKYNAEGELISQEDQKGEAETNDQY